MTYGCADVKCYMQDCFRSGAVRGKSLDYKRTSGLLTGSGGEGGGGEEVGVGPVGGGGGGGTLIQYDQFLFRFSRSDFFTCLINWFWGGN